MKLNSYYERILELKEADEFKEIVQKWQTLSDNMKRFPTDAPILLPDMLWIAKSGVGKTNLLRLLSEYFAERGNLVSFYGDVKYFEFMMCYCSPMENFTEILRLMDEVDNAAGFRSEFMGIIHIDIDEWVGHCEEKHFVSFMEYLAANSDKWFIVLSVSGGDEKEVQKMEAFISMYLRIERVTISLPKTEELFEYIENYLKNYGLSLDNNAKNLLYYTIEKLRKNKYFDGFKTIKMLCQDIVYSTYSKPGKTEAILGEEDVAQFAYGGEYVKRRVFNIEKVGKIGLLNRGDDNE